VFDADHRVTTQRKLSVERIISGGQTGVDRGALDAAISLEMPHGGWCPRGRLAEDGCIPTRYQLVETETAQYRERTELNVVDSDGTLILFRRVLRGGTELTRRLAVEYQKPHLMVDLAQPLDISVIRQWLLTEAIRILNVAGPRESSSPGIAEESRKLLESLFRGRARS
jgi:hypothetical protein